MMSYVETERFDILDSLHIKLLENARELNLPLSLNFSVNCLRGSIYPKHLCYTCPTYVSITSLHCELLQMYETELKAL